MKALYDSKSKSLNDRGIKTLLSFEAKLESWLQVEAALAKAQAEEGFIPKEAAEQIAAHCKLENIDLDEMRQIQERVGHGFVPFLKVLTKACGEEAGKYVHYGITTQNVQQTGQLFLIKKINHIFYSFFADILNNLSKLAFKHSGTVMSGRTHGKHAMPITFGYKVSVWIRELLTCLERLRECEKRVFQVMMGGAVGTFNSMGEKGPKIQKQVAKLLNMESMEVPSRSISSHKEEYIFQLAMLCNTLHRIAEEVYYGGIEEFSELSEPFKKGTIGSSTMPQKINPKLAKGIISNSQKLYSLVPLGLFSGTRMYEGDSSAYMLHENILEEAVELTTALQVNEKQMYKNACINKGLDNCEYVMMCIAKKLGKDKAHELLYEKAMLTELEGKDFYTVLKEDALISKTFSEEELKRMLKPESYIGLSREIAEYMADKARNVAEQLRE